MAFRQKGDFRQAVNEGTAEYPFWPGNGFSAGLRRYAWIASSV
ncbi:MAG: hypothetical protein U1F16_17525 [Turneriella sp.]